MRLFTRLFLPFVLLLPLALAAPAGAAPADRCTETVANRPQPPPVVLRLPDGTVRLWAADFMQPMPTRSDTCGGGDELPEALGEWQVSMSEWRELEQVRSSQRSLGGVLPAATGYGYCECSLPGVTAFASTCAPDCHGDCDEGHDGSTCHVHQYYRRGSFSYLTFIDDFVDCCECSSSTTDDCGNWIDTDNCGSCADNSGLNCWGSGGIASCCVSSSSNYVRNRRRASQSSVAARTVFLYPGNSGTLSNQIDVTQGGREDCDGGSRDGWRSYSFKPDRNVSSFTVGSYVSYSWSCSAGMPTLSGSGYSCTCYPGTPSCSSDGYCDGLDPVGDPDCDDCGLSDGICTPGCDLYIPDPDCGPCDFPGDECTPL